MRRVCLTLPTNRACAATLTAVAEEAAYGARRFGAEVHLLVLDSSEPDVLAEHRRVTAALPPVPGVVVHHLDEDEQRAFLRDVIDRSGAAAPERLLGLMLPSQVSYGACTNRAFLIAEALGCVSVHRRDSDSRYQYLDGEPVFPLHHELTALGRRAGDLTGTVSRSRLDPALAHRPVAVVGGSFVGAMSVDVEEIRRLDPAVYEDVVGLSVPAGYPEIDLREHVVERRLVPEDGGRLVVQGVHDVRVGRAEALGRPREVRGAPEEPETQFVAVPRDGRQIDSAAVGRSGLGGLRQGLEGVLRPDPSEVVGAGVEEAAVVHAGAVDAQGHAARSDDGPGSFDLRPAVVREVTDHEHPRSRSQLAAVDAGHVAAQVDGPVREVDRAGGELLRSDRVPEEVPDGVVLPQRRWRDQDVARVVDARLRRLPCARHTPSALRGPDTDMATARTPSSASRNADERGRTVGPR